jgi:hypothetical protein
MMEVIVVITKAITKGSWKGMIMAGMKPKNITRRYPKEGLEKPSNNGRMKAQMKSVLRKYQKNMRNQK